MWSLKMWRRLADQSRRYGIQITSPKEYIPNELKEELSKEMMQDPDYFRVHKMFTVRDLFESRVHYGHTEGTLDRRMLPYVYGARLGHVIFDLDKTAVYLRRALNFAAHIAYRDGVVLFVTRTAQHALLVEQTALDCGEFAHTRPWIHGTFLNSTMQFGAVTRLPDLLIFLNSLDTVLEQHRAITDSAKMLIPTIAIVDSNCNPNLVTYPVPGNDDSLVSIQLYCRLFKEAILRGKQKRKDDSQARQ